MGLLSGSCLATQLHTHTQAHRLLHQPAQGGPGGWTTGSEVKLVGPAGQVVAPETHSRCSKGQPDPLIKPTGWSVEPAHHPHGHRQASRLAGGPLASGLLGTPTALMGVLPGGTPLKWPATRAAARPSTTRPARAQWASQDGHTPCPDPAGSTRLQADPCCHPAHVCPPTPTHVTYLELRSSLLAPTPAAKEPRRPLPTEASVECWHCTQEDRVTPLAHHPCRP